MSRMIDASELNPDFIYHLRHGMRELYPFIKDIIPKCTKWDELFISSSYFKTNPVIDATNVKSFKNAFYGYDNTTQHGMIGIVLKVSADANLELAFTENWYLKYVELICEDTLKTSNMKDMFYRVSIDAFRIFKYTCEYGSGGLTATDYKGQRNRMYGQVKVDCDWDLTALNGTNFFSGANSSFAILVKECFVSNVGSTKYKIYIPSRYYNNQWDGVSSEIISEALAKNIEIVAKEA